MRSSASNTQNYSATGRLETTTARSTFNASSVVGMCLLFGAASYAGTQLFAYERVSDLMAEKLTADRRTASQNTDKSSLLQWTTSSGVSGYARALWLGIMRVETPENYNAIERALINTIEVSPTSAADWQELAEIRAQNGAAFDSVLAAFRMSHLTGSNMGGLMIRRAIFGLQHWTRMPPAERRIVVRDLLATVGPKAGRRYQDILGQKSFGERDDIRAALAASGLASLPVLQSLGL